MRIALVGAELEENLALRYIRGALERCGHEVRQIPFNCKKEIEEAAGKLVESGAILAGFSMVFTHRAREFACLASRARELGFTGHITAGGHFAAFNAIKLLQDVLAFDSMVIGEGEEIIVDLATHLDTPGAVRGLVWRDSKGRAVQNAAAPKPLDLDHLPQPARKNPPATYLGLPIVNMLSSRGCTHSCAFCSIAAWHRLCGGERFRQRSPANVAEEMARLYRNGIRIFNFHDDNFILVGSRQSLERFFLLERELRSRGVGKVAFAIKSRPESVEPHLFAHLKSMGLFRVFLGVEAGSAESLRQLGRGQTREQNVRALEILAGLDIHTCFNLLMLNPDSRLEDFAANVRFLREHHCNPTNFCRTEIYAGTPLEQRLRKQGRLLGDYWGYDYRIADPRAQQVFEILRVAFRQRNYGEQGIHHQAMRLDYEHQLLVHFFGESDGLRRCVKEHVQRVNLNTCDHLEAIVSAVEKGLSARDARRFAKALGRRVETDDHRLWKRGEKILRELQSSARDRRTGEISSWKRRAAAAGLAATLSLSGAACERRETHPFEMAPPPPAEAAILRDAVAQQLLPRVAKKLDSASRLEIEVELGATGRIIDLKIRQEGRQVIRPLTVQDVTDIRFEDPHARGRRFCITFSKEEVEARMETDGRTHFEEMVPVPPREGGNTLHTEYIPIWPDPPPDRETPPEGED